MMRPYDVEANAGFPRTPVIDNFNRANGRIDSGWKGDANVDQFSMVNQAVKVGLGGAVYWNSRSFGPNQEAYFTFTNPSLVAKEQDLILKLTGGNPTSSTAQMIDVLYDLYRYREHTIRTRARAILCGRMRPSSIQPGQQGHL